MRTISGNSSLQPTVNFNANCGVGAGVVTTGTDPDKERDPPAQPTPVTFPAYETSEPIAWKDVKDLPDLQALFARILKPSDISQQHNAALNVEVIEQCALDDLVPLASDGASYFPPLKPDQVIDAASYANAMKANGNVAKLRSDLDSRLAELKVDNDTAYRTITRSMKNGIKPPKLAYMRKFFEGLESVSGYWDCSLDQYYEVTEEDGEGGSSAKRMRLDLKQPKIIGPASSGSISRQIDADLREFATALGPQLSDDMPAKEQLDTVTSDSATSTERKDRSNSASPEPQPRLRYKGRRTNTGRDMPDQFRADTVRAFVEGTVWPFQCSVAPPRMMPIVQFAKLSLPVRQTAAVYRIPKDRMRARQGRLEGPLIVLQVRAGTDFVSDDGETQEAKARLDFMRELGGLLQLAQERRREGKTELKPGEGKWWTTEPRWGGGPGGEMESEGAANEIVQATEELLGELKEAKNEKVERSRDGSHSRKKKTPALLWRELKCGSGFWDPKTDYMAIGKDPASPYDDVFMISSLNHHISILKLTVHEAYVDYLISGEAPEPIPDNAAWCRPRLQRSQWFDLLDLGQRIEAFRALWGVVAYLTRDVHAATEAKVGAGDDDVRRGAVGA